MKRLLLFCATGMAVMNGCELLEESKDFDPPVLFNLGVELGAYNPGTGRAGALVFDTSFQRVFFEFGAIVNGPDGPKVLPTFEYVVGTDTRVMAPAAGVVTRVAFQDDSQDYEIHIRPKSNSVWNVVLDHVASPEVDEEMAVGAGDEIGDAGTGASASLRRTEIMVVNDDTERAWCPLAVFDPGTLATNSAIVLGVMTAWENVKGDPSIYDEGTMSPPGCQSTTLDN